MRNDKSREITYAEAIFEGISQEMEVDPSVFCYGLGVDDAKGMYGTTKGLHQIFGKDRNFDTPISEDAMTGMGIGAAMAGLRPIHVHQRMDFLLLCMNQLINMAAKQSYMFDSVVSVPLVVRAIIGRSWGQGAQHSQSFHSFFSHIPGIRVIAPTTPFDAKGAMISSIRENNPVIFLEHRMLYGNRGLVPEQSYEVEFGKSRILRAGSDVTVIGVSHMVVEALRAADILKSEKGISAEVIDLLSISPIDWRTLCESLKKTGNLVIVDNSWTACGVSAELMAGIVERFSDLGVFRVARMGFAPAPCPTTKPLENAFYPNASSIARKCFELISPNDEEWIPTSSEAKEILDFKGPF